MINFLPRRWQVFLVLLPLYSTAVASDLPDTLITGRVTDAAQQPLPGVSVSLKGTGIGTVTNTSGNYSLRVNTAKGVLVFSFIGSAKKEVAFNGPATINVQMESDQKALGEVVVVGYGTQKKVNLVGSVAAIKVDEKITSRAWPNASSALSGLVPGLSATQSTGMAVTMGPALLSVD